MEPTGEKQPSSRIWLWIGAAFVGFWAVILFFFTPRRFEDLIQVGPDADYQLAFEDLRGKPLTLKDFRGKPIFLNFWATWCGPCIEEMPSIADLAANPRLKDVAFVCISIDEGLPEVREFVRENKLPLQVYHIRGAVPGVYNVSGIPATYFIDRKGIIVKDYPGSQNWNTAAVIDELATLATGPATPANAGAR